MTESSLGGIRVVVVVPDLFFSTRIAETAKQLGVVWASSSLAEALEACRPGPATLMIVDLEQQGDVVEVIRGLKADPVTRSVRVVGFYSHVRKALRQTALDAGVDLVLPRSAFTARLARVLAGDGGTAA
jgi:CheY-like chemotaxis protein